MTIPDAVSTIVKQKGKSIYHDIWGFAKLLRTLAPMPQASKKEVNIIRIGVDKNLLELFVKDGLPIEDRLEQIKTYLENLGLSYDSILYLMETFGNPLGYEESINNLRTSNIIIEIKQTDALSQNFEIEDVILTDDTLKQLGYKNKHTITQIEIPSTFSTYSGVMYKIIAIGNGVFANCPALTRVVIPNTVVDININAFYGCTSLKEIVIPESVKFIGESAFENCTSLTNIKIPESINGIIARTFCGCESLTEINLPNNVKFIGESAFEKCISLTKIQIPESVKKISKRTFYDCTSLKEVIIPDTVTDIETMAFCGCESLNNLVIPPKVVNLGVNLFSNCKNLTSITIPVQFLRENLILSKDQYVFGNTSKDLKTAEPFDPVIPETPSDKLSQEKLMALNQELYQKYRKKTMTKNELIDQFKNEIMNIMYEQ